MEDQGKRLLLAVAVAFAIMMAWTYLFPADKPEEAAKKDAPAEVDRGVRPSESAPAAGGAAAPAAAGAAATQAAPRAPEQTFQFDSAVVRAEFTSYGGALKSWQLLGDQFHEPGKPGVPEDLVRLRQGERYPFTVAFTDGSTFAIPPGVEWKGEKLGDREILFTWQSDDLLVEKRFRLHPADYLLEMDVAFQVKRGRAKQGLVVSVSSEQDPKTKVEGGWTEQPREWKGACYVDGELETWSASSLAERAREERGEVEWAGFLHSYFFAAVAPRADADNLGCRAYGLDESVGAMGVDLVFPLASLEPGSGDRVETGVVAYFGPKYLQRLEAISASLEIDTGFEKAVDLGFWGFIAGPLLWLLQRFYEMVGSWGIAIILLTMVVKLATLYWTHKSMKSMKAMARLRPQLDKLKEKYKDDKQKQQVETMNLFKAHGVNPLAGCLPILLQMPIWFALYKALSVAAELYQAEFLWFSDLTLPDPYFILPVFMVLTMLLQARLTPTTATGMQQKMLQYGMPLMFGAFSFFFPAGLTLYICTNTVLTLFHHLYMLRTDPHPMPAADKAGVKSAATGPAAVIDVVDDGEDDDGGSGATRGKASAARTPAGAESDPRPSRSTRAHRPGGGRRGGGRRKRGGRPS